MELNNLNNKDSIKPITAKIKEVARPIIEKDFKYIPAASPLAVPLAVTNIRILFKLVPPAVVVVTVVV